MNVWIFGCSAMLAVCAAPAATQVAPVGQVDQPQLLTALLACRLEVDDGSRLACFDRASGAFETAERDGEITVVDRTQAQRTREQLFGLNLGAANIFGRLRFDEAVDAVETTLSSARQDPNGRWIFTLADASVWRQVDTERLRSRPVQGASVRIRRAAVGSYMLSVGGARSVRARREE